MKRHVSLEQLSAYLDQELGFGEMRQLEAHCSVCEECNARLISTRRVVKGLGTVRRAAPPAGLHQQLRRQILADPPSRGLGRALEGLRLRLFPLQPVWLFPRQPTLRTAALMGLASVVGLVTWIHGTATPPAGARPAQEVVTAEAYPDLAPLPTTTSEVAGRKFILTEEGWVQRGLEGKTPEALLDARSPRGRALLTRFSDLRLLLEDGSSVVLRYNLETVELRSTAPSRVLGYDSRPRPGTRHGREVAV
jgi:putative zinc finger protein